MSGVLGRRRRAVRRLWTDHILASITRDTVLERGAEERPLTKVELLGAREAFLASTVREVQSVAAVEEREFPATGGDAQGRRGLPRPWRRR